MEPPPVKDPRRKQRGFQRNCSIMSGESCPPTPPNMDAIHPHRKQWGILSCFREWRLNVLGIHAIYEGVNILDDDKLSDDRRMPKGEVLLASPRAV